MNIVCTNCIKRVLVIFICCSFATQSHAQQIPDSKNNIPLYIKFADKDSSFDFQALKLQTLFNSLPAAMEYVSKLPALLTSNGYPVASVDSIRTTEAALYILVYLGTKYNWVQLNPVNIEKRALDQSGFLQKNFLNKPINLLQLQSLQQRLLNFYEKEGFPFASVYLDSVRINDDKILAQIKADRGVLYHIDSIRVYGKVNLSKKFLQHYLNISNGSPYNRERLQLVDKRMRELPYLTPVQPSDLTMLGTGSVLNVYVQPKPSSQVNFLIGFLPATGQTGKVQLTGDVNLDLKNLLGTGEAILLKWQQLQLKSPRLNLGYNQPYIFNSAFGFDFLFDLFKKDSSFLLINAQLGLQFALASNQTGKIFFQWQKTGLLSGAVDTNIIISQKKLPEIVDESSTNIGINYDWINTNYRYNPITGNEINILATIGVKNIKPNSDIINIKDPNFNYATLYDSIKLRTYQLRLKLAAAHYFKIGKSSTIKTSINTGLYSSPAIFKNELFQIGGYKLLRGFDEESIYATKYAVITGEYRNLISLNSYLFLFIDAALVNNKYQSVNVNNQFIGAGIGIVYETKLGILNLSYAMGKRDDIRFNLKSASKIHFGYINYF